jgi:hypothetical protein
MIPFEVRRSKGKGDGNILVKIFAVYRRNIH